MPTLPYLFPIAILPVHQNRWIAVGNHDQRIFSGHRTLTRLAYCLDQGPAADNDADRAAFWDAPAPLIAMGNTPDEALAALHAREKNETGHAAWWEAQKHPGFRKPVEAPPQ